MKFITLLSMAVLSTFSTGVFADDGGKHDVLAPISDVYIPSGFDSSSEAFVVVNGLFPSSCYKLKNATVSHVGPALHEIRTNAFVLEGTCLMVLVPFHKEVQIGKLSAGEHTLRFVNDNKTFMDKNLTIER